MLPYSDSKSVSKLTQVKGFDYPPTSENHRFESCIDLSFCFCILRALYSLFYFCSDLRRSFSSVVRDDQQISE